MRYWGLFAGKLAISGAISYGLLLGINSFWPARFPVAFVRVNPAGASLPIGRTAISAAPPRNWYVGDVRLLLPEDIPVAIQLKDAAGSNVSPVSRTFGSVPAGDNRERPARASRFGFDLVYTSVVGLWFLATAGLLYLGVLDQRYRCRVCLRRLRMPIETGSWGRMLFAGRPRIEYICTYGHGTLKEEELQISGLENPEWTESGDMWAELCATSKDAEPRQ
jgi:hypothetical protein